MALSLSLSLSLPPFKVPTSYGTRPVSLSTGSHLFLFACRPYLVRNCKMYQMQSTSTYDIHAFRKSLAAQEFWQAETHFGETKHTLSCDGQSSFFKPGESDRSWYCWGLWVIGFTTPETRSLCSAALSSLLFLQCQLVSAFYLTSVW